MSKYTDYIDGLTPVVNLRLDEASGTTAVDVGTAALADSTYVGAYPLAHPLVTGDTSAGLATDDYIEFPIGSLSAIGGSTAASVVMWFNPGAIPAAAAVAMLYDALVDGASTSGLQVYMTDTAIEAAVRSTTADTPATIASGSLPTEGDLVMVGVTINYTSNVVNLYVNGKLAGSNAAAGFGASSYTHGTPTAGDRIGSTVPGASFYTGRLAHFALFNSLLTAATMWNIYQAGLGNTIGGAYQIVGHVTHPVSGVPLARPVCGQVAESGIALSRTISDVADAGKFVINCPDANAVHLLAMDDYGYLWKGSEAYFVGELAIPVIPNGHYYKVTVAGTTSATEPTWPTAGGTVVDGGVTWEDQGLVTDPEIIGWFKPEAI